MSDLLATPERRGDEPEVFDACRLNADYYVARYGTQKLVDALRQARDSRLRIKLGTTNTLILLAHIDGLEAAHPETDEDGR